jgi:Peptidase family M23/PA14 domain
LEIPALALRRRLLTGARAAIALTAIGLILAQPAAAATARAPSPTVEFRLPFPAGQSYRINQGWHGSYSHTGLSAFAYDFGLPEGTPVVAAAAGVVAFVHDGEHACGGPGFRNDSNSVTIYHADGTATLYAHLLTVTARVGQAVAGGQQIGLSGKTGFSTCQAHLHFARQAQGGAVEQSQPIYFAEYGHRRLWMYEVVTSDNPACVVAAAGLPTNRFCGIYSTVLGAATLRTAKLDASIDLESTATASREAATLGPMSVRWVGRFAFEEAGRYSFMLSTTGKARLWIDGIRVVDGWDNRSEAAEYLLPLWMTPGPHVIRVDYRSTAVSQIRLSWSPDPEDPNARAVD